MRNRPLPQRPADRELRLAVECLPLRTREAMLEGVLSSPRIIVGAYTDREGGVCPMLAAHRRGGRTNFLSFARSWDRFTHARRRRRATRHELAVLVGLLRASLMDEESCDLAPRDRRAHASCSRATGVHARADPTGDPTGEIVARRLARPALAGAPPRARLRAYRYSRSPGRTNIISGTMQAGETRSR